jgi:hypothetical protein
MAQHDYNLANQSGLSFRQDLNNALAAIVSQNSGSSAPSTTYAYQWWIDTSVSPALLKLRNAANSAWLVVGDVTAANLGLATQASPSFTGTATFSGDVLLSGTGQLDLPAGTTAQRTGSPNSGMVRFNTTLGQFEGYNGTAWGQLGGGATGGGSDVVFLENGNTVTTNYTLTTNKNAVSAGPVTVNSGVTVTIPSGASWVIV